LTTFQVVICYGIFLSVHLVHFIVSGLSWAGYTDCDHYYSEYESHEDIVGDCARPACQLALMITNIFAIVISSFVVALVSNTLCCGANQSAAQNLHTSTIRISTIDTPADTPDFSTGTRTAVNDDKNPKISLQFKVTFEIARQLFCFGTHDEDVLAILLMSCSQSVMEILWLGELINSFSSFLLLKIFSKNCVYVGY
jgi:hypothetical protein